MDPVPNPLLLRKSGRAGNQTRDLCTCSQKLWPLDHRGGRWIHKATKKHTLRTCNTSCFSTATVAARTRLNVLRTSISCLVYHTSRPRKYSKTCQFLRMSTRKIPDIWVNEYGALVEWYWQGNLRHSKKTLYQPQVLHLLAWYWTQAPAVKGRQTNPLSHDTPSASLLPPFPNNHPTVGYKSSVQDNT